MGRKIRADWNQLEQAAAAPAENGRKLHHSGDGKLSAACRKGRADKAHPDCYKLSCPCECHKRQK